MLGGKLKRETMNWKQLKEEGWYLRKESGTYKGFPHTSYALTKDNDDGTRSTICFVNLKAFRELIKMFSFEVKESLNVCWLNHCDSMDFSTQTKEALKITFHF